MGAEGRNFHKTFATKSDAQAEMSTNPGKYTAIIEKPINPDQGDLSLIMQYHREQAKPGTPVFKYFYPNGKPKSSKGKPAKGNDTCLPQCAIHLRIKDRRTS